MAYGTRQSALFVIVTDDDPAVRDSLQFSLGLEGYDVRTCASGEALLELPLPHANACLIIDERLPGISGLETLQRLRAREVGLPAILVTSHAARRTRRMAASLGAPVVEKPLIGEALSVAIRDAVGDGAEAADTTH